ncbi:hypothetical protein PoB_003162700 [Plakobranchus ocellatus]|uniref:Uncharacterized protein n=1 Tax=Plakobranchus ocellatus TaxID=259542 RepID=A0AAV4ACX2_9GAST|nr:hypothetical protein PoB_003162700 [Plakobranchus ocellatus]
MLFGLLSGHVTVGGARTRNRKEPMRGPERVRKVLRGVAKKSLASPYKIGQGFNRAAMLSAAHYNLLVCS